MSTNLPIEERIFIEFLLKARRHGWAGSVERIEIPESPSFKELIYEEDFDFGKLNYRDSYMGYYSAPGREVVRLNDSPIWSMAYDGGMDPKFYGNLEFTCGVFSFLKEALLQANVGEPFRGPSSFSKGDLLYTNLSEGNICRFKGTETIYNVNRYGLNVQQKRVFEQNYFGGVIVHK